MIEYLLYALGTFILIMTFLWVLNKERWWAMEPKTPRAVAIGCATFCAVWGKAGFYGSIFAILFMTIIMVGSFVWDKVSVSDWWKDPL